MSGPHSKYDAIRVLGAVFIGGAVGSLLRAAVDTALPAQPGSWPWATFGVNIVGAGLLGWVLARTWQTRRQRYLPPLLGTGLCGGLTTFSTLQLELLQFVDAGKFGWAATYVGASVIAGLGVLALAIRLTRIRQVES